MQPDTTDDNQGEAGTGDRAGTADRPARRHGIDLRRFEPRERLPLLEMSLATLEPGEALEVTLEYWPEALSRYLERTYADEFDWWELGRAETWCSLAIRRRTDRAGGR